MNILIIGSGGREHALGWKIKKSPKCDQIYFSPGNGGTEKIGENVKIDFSDHQNVISFCKDNNIDLVVVAPDDYLADGLVNSLQKENIPAFGPTKESAKIEWSKDYAKNFMTKFNIPTASYQTFNNYDQATSYIENIIFPTVIKADGLALGKGVIIAKNRGEAKQALDDLMNKKIHGDSGSNVVIEEFLVGKEISVHAFCDGKNYALLPSSQDNKRAYDNDEGPNTGGMGTIAPVPWVEDSLMKDIETKIIKPIINGMIKEGHPFSGVLFPGIMVTKDGPKVIEINARFGDPETQSYMRILKSDLLEILFDCAGGNLKPEKIEWSAKYASCVVLASGGYPKSYNKGFVIDGLNNIEDGVEIFHAGTKSENNKIVTNGGRVLNVTNIGNSLEDSLNKVYQAVEKLSFKDMFYRKDIGRKSIKD